MRIITLGRLAGSGGGDDHFYPGTGYLLRFGIESPEHFFARQLPFIVRTLRIDVRQIMHLELLGDGYSGLGHARVCISFEDADSGAKRPENAIKKLQNTPSQLLRDPITISSGDVLRKRLIEFLSVAPGAVKSRFLKESEEAMQHKKALPENLPYVAGVAGVQYKVCFWAGSPPNIDEWRNTVLHCSERLRNNFVPEQIDRVTFVPIPNTEQDYRVDAEFILPGTPKVYRERCKLRFQSPPAKTTKGVISFEPELGGPERKLSDAERATLHKFDELDTRERLLLWNKHLSKFFS